MEEQSTPQPRPEVSVELRVWLLGLAWAMIATLAPVGIVLWRWTQNWADPPDLNATLWLTGTLMVQGAASYWRKHKALLQMPPILAKAKELQK